MKQLILLLFGVLCFSCHHTMKNDKVVDMQVIDGFPSTLDLEQMVDSVSFIPLDDSNSESLFKDIDKTLYVGGRFYILDYMGTSSVFVFDESGSFLFKVGNVGQGPGEYYKVTDFDVNNGRIYLLDSKKRKILSYDLDGKYMKDYKYLGKIEGVNDLIVTNEGDFLLGMDVELNSREQVLLVDSNFTIKNRVLDFTDETTRSQLKVGCFRRCGDEIVYHYPISNKFYIFDSKGKILKDLDLLLGEEIDKDIRKDFWKVSVEREKQNLSYFYKTPFICNDFLVTEAFYRSKNAIVCADLDAREFFLKEYSVDAPFSLADFNFPLYMDDEKVVCRMSGGVYNRLDEDSKSMMKGPEVDCLNNGGVVFVVYHLNRN